MAERKLRNWAFIRPYCSPTSGVIQAYEAKEAIDLVHEVYGFASNTSIYCAETGERLVDESRFGDDTSRHMINAHRRGDITLF